MALQVHRTLIPIDYPGSLKERPEVVRSIEKMEKLGYRVKVADIKVIEKYPEYGTERLWWSLDVRKPPVLRPPVEEVPVPPEVVVPVPPVIEPAPPVITPPVIKPPVVEEHKYRLLVEKVEGKERAVMAWARELGGTVHVETDPVTGKTLAIATFPRELTKRELLVEMPTVKAPIKYELPLGMFLPWERQMHIKEWAKGVGAEVKFDIRGTERIAVITAPKELTEKELDIKLPTLKHIEAKRRESKVEKIYEEMSWGEKTLMHAQSFFSPRGFEYAFSYIPGGKEPAAIVKQQMMAALVKPSFVREQTIGAVFGAPTAFIPAAYVAGVGAGAVVGKVGPAIVAKVPGVAKVGAVFTSKLGQAAVVTGIGGLEAIKVKKMAKEGKIAEEIAAEVARDVTGILAFAGGMKAGLKRTLPKTHEEVVALAKEKVTLGKLRTYESGSIIYKPYMTKSLGVRPAKEVIKIATKGKTVASGLGWKVKQLGKFQALIVTKPGAVASKATGLIDVKRAEMFYSGRLHGMDIYVRQAAEIPVTKVLPTEFKIKVFKPAVKPTVPWWKKPFVTKPEKPFEWMKPPKPVEEIGLPWTPSKGGLAMTRLDPAVLRELYGVPVPAKVAEELVVYPVIPPAVGIVEVSPEAEAMLKVTPLVVPKVRVRERLKVEPAFFPKVKLKKMVMPDIKKILKITPVVVPVPKIGITPIPIITEIPKVTVTPVPVEGLVPEMVTPIEEIWRPVPIEPPPPPEIKVPPPVFPTIWFAPPVRRPRVMPIIPTAKQMRKYRPSLIGMAFLEPVTREPERLLTGLGIRPPVKKRKKKKKRKIKVTKRKPRRKTRKKR